MCGHCAGCGLSENMPRNSSSEGCTGTMPWAWWSTAGIAQSASSRVVAIAQAAAGPRAAPRKANAGSVTLSQ